MCGGVLHSDDLQWPRFLIEETESCAEVSALAIDTCVEFISSTNKHIDYLAGDNHLHLSVHPYFLKGHLLDQLSHFCIGLTYVGIAQHIKNCDTSNNYHRKIVNRPNH